MLIIWFIFTIISLNLISRSKKILLLFLLFLFLFFLITDIYIISNYFTWNWIDEAFIYHLSYWIDWAGLKSDIYIIIIWLLLLLVTFIIPVIIYKYLILKNKKTNIRNTILAFLLLFISFSIHPFTKNILELNWYFIFDSIKNTTLEKTFEEMYIIPDKQKVWIDNKNVIFIYLESFENLYLDGDLFPWLSNWLNEIKNNSTYFNNIKQVYWTSRTIAWMVWSQCWIPLINSWGGWNSMHWISSFLPGAFCIWDFLKNAWYDLSYIWWSKLSFAGKGNFYNTHWFDNIEWKDELILNIKNKKYQYDWGLYDDTVFDLAYKKYEKLSKKEKKFWLFMLNLDTHGSEWVVSKECNNLKYNKDKNSILNSYYCTDYLLTNFINKIKNNNKFKDTIIVLASDHYAMAHNNSSDILNKKQEDRRILFVIIDPSKTNKIIEKKGTTLDIWATVLWSMWFNVNNLWLGVNLLNIELKTIEEKYENFIFSKWKRFYESFWEYPSIKKWFTINTDDLILYLDKKDIEFPALIYLDSDIEIEKILWRDKYNPVTLFEKIPKKSNSIYIDFCDKINTEKKWMCILYTNSKGKRKDYSIKDNEDISINKIKENLR